MRVQLRAGSLSFIEVLAAAVALIGLSMTPVLIAPYMFGAAGNGAWLAYVFAGIMLLLVAMNLNQFARRSTCAGSMFVYAARELGPALGAMMGFGLLWSYIFVGTANFGAQALFWGQVFAMVGLSLPQLTTSLIAMGGLGAVCWLLSVRDIALSTVVMLVLEGISVGIICVVIGIVIARHPAVDSAQLHLIGMSKAGIGIGIATAVFSFVGFESATAFGAEAKNALRNIPQAVIWSVIIASIFFVFALYAEILGLRGSKPSLDQLSAPLSTLAGVLGVSYLKVPITIGAICSSFSVTLACVNSGARIMLPMTSGALLPKRLDAIHPRFATPYVALAITVIAMLVIALGMLALRVRPIDIFNYCGVLSALSFIFVYLLIAIAAMLYLRRIGELRLFDVVISVITCLCLAAAAITLFYPTPTPPDNVFPYLFGIYLVICYGIYLASRRVKLADAE